MEDAKINTLEEPDLKNSILIEGLPGIGLVGKLAVEHMLDEFDATKFAELYSPYLPPQVLIQEDGTIELDRMELHYCKIEKGDLIMLVGESQGMKPHSQYRITERILDFAEKFDLNKIYTLGGLGTGKIVKSPKVYGATSNKELVEEMQDYDIVFKGGGGIFGAAGLLLGIGMQRGHKGVCLMGETHGQIIDAKAAEAVLNVLAEILDLEMDMSKLEDKAEKTEKQMKKVKEMVSKQKKSMEEGEIKDTTSSYIR